MVDGTRKMFRGHGAYIKLDVGAEMLRHDNGETFLAIVRGFNAAYYGNVEIELMTDSSTVDDARQLLALHPDVKRYTMVDADMRR